LVEEVVEMLSVYEKFHPRGEFQEMILRLTAKEPINNRKFGSCGEIPF
jgi:hypothetical protein